MLLTGAVGSLEHGTIDLVARLIAAQASMHPEAQEGDHRPAKRAKVNNGASCILYVHMHVCRECLYAESDLHLMGDMEYRLYWV